LAGLLCVRIELFMLTTPSLLSPMPTLLPEKVLLLTVSVPPLLKMPPPCTAALPAKVQLVMVSAGLAPSLKMPPPKAALLRAKVLLVMVAVPKVQMPAPTPLRTSLSENVLLMTVTCQE
jgi:hypothetical protein